MTLVFDFSEDSGPPKNARGPPPSFGQRKAKSPKPPVDQENKKPEVVKAKKKKPPKKWEPQIDESKFDLSKFSDPFNTNNSAKMGFDESDPTRPKDALVVHGNSVDAAAEQESPEVESEVATHPPEKVSTGDKIKGFLRRLSGGSPAKEKTPPATPDFTNLDDPFNQKAPPKMANSPDLVAAKVPDREAIKAGAGFASDSTPFNVPEQALTTGDGPVGTGPLEDRLVDKNWKVRAEAFEELASEFAKGDQTVYPQYSRFLKKMVVDANPPCLDKALEAVSVFCEKADDAAASAGAILSGILKKAFAGRSTSVATAQEVCLHLIAAGATEEVISSMKKGCKDRAYKVVIASCNTLQMGLHAFGPKVVPVQAVQSVILGVFDNPKVEARKAAQDLSIEIYRWLGPLFKDYLATTKLKPSIISELESQFEDVPVGKARPERYLRGQKAPAAPKGSPSQSKSSRDVEEDEGFDPLSLIEAIDVCGKLSKNWSAGCSSGKWKDRKEKVDELLDLCSRNPKIKPGPRFIEVVSGLRRLLVDVNVNVLAVAVKALDALAKGLGSEFRDSAKQATPNLIEALKEKKLTVTKPICDALDTFFEHCYKLSDVTDSIIAGLQNKVPKVRQDVLSWLLRCLQSEKASGGGNGVMAAAQALAPALVAALSEGDADVRKIAQKVLTEIISTCGQKPLTEVLSKLEADAKKWATICKDAAKADRSAGAADAEVEVAKQPSPVKPKVTRKRAPSASSTSTSKKTSSAPAVPSSDKTSATSKTSAKPTAKGAPASVKVEKFVPSAPMDYESAKEVVAQYIDEAIMQQLEEKKWQEVVAGLEASKQCVEDAGEDCKEYGKAFFYFLQKTPSFKPINFNICKNVYFLCAQIAKSSPEGSFTKTMAYLPLEAMLEKLGDAKIFAAAKEAIEAFCEAVGPQFMLSQLYNKLKNVKSIKSQEAAVEVVASLISDFGVASFDTRNTISMVKEWYEHKSAKVRANATQVYISIYRQAGEVLVDMMLDGLRPATIEIIKQEFDAIPANEVGQSTAVKGIKGSDGPPAEVNMDDVLPRVDISSKITDKLVRSMDDDNWKNRQEAMQQVEQILADANHRIGPKDGGLFAALKDRLMDKNKNLVKHALEIVKTVCDDMGSGCSKHVSKVILGVCTCLADSKVHIKTQAKSTLAALMINAGSNSCFKKVGKGLSNTAARDGALAVVKEQVEREIAAGTVLEFDDLVEPLVSCLQDKDSKVRKLSEAILGSVVKTAGFAVVKSRTADLKKATLLQLKPILDNLEKIEGAAAPAEPSLPESRDASNESSPVKKKPSTKSSALRVAPKSVTKKPSKSTASSTASAKSKDEVSSSDNNLTLKSSSDKDKERRLAQEMKKPRGQFIELSSNEIQELKDRLGKVVSEPLHKQLFHKNFTEQVQGLEQLGILMKTLLPEFISNLDLILKWIALRVSVDTNTKVLLAIIKFLEELFVAIKSDEYVLDDGEVQMFLPYLIEKVFGHNNVKFRTDTKALMQQTCKIYPASKVCAQLVLGFGSKNTRVVAECVDEVGCMVAREGMDVIEAKKVLPDVARLVGSNNTGIRQASLSCLSEVYKIVGDDVYKYIESKKSKLDKKTADMITERLKRVNVGPSTKSQTKQTSRSLGLKPFANRTLKTPSRNSFADDDAIKAAVAETPVQEPAEQPAFVEVEKEERFAASIEVHDIDLVDLDGFADDLHDSPDPFGLERALFKQLQSPEEDTRIAAMKDIWMRLVKEGPSIVRPETDRLVNVLSAQIEASFVTVNPKTDEIEIRHRLCKYALNTMMEVFKETDVARDIHITTLEKLQKGLLTRLLDVRVRNIEDGKGVMKGLNVLMLKVLENADRTSSFHILLKFLKSDVHNPDATKGFVGLVIKCLLKLTKKLAEADENSSTLNLDILLHDIHDFFETHPPATYQGKDDMPLKAVRTTLSELIKLTSASSIRSHIQDVPSTSVLVQYIERLSRQVDNTAAEASTTSSAEPTGDEKQTNNETETELEAIFERLHQKETTQAALKELHEFTVAHSDVDIQPHIDKCREVFRDFITRHLARLKVMAAPATPTQALSSTAPSNSSSGTPSSFSERLAQIKSARVTPIKASPPKPDIDSIRARVDDQTSGDLAERLASLKANSSGNPASSGSDSSHMDRVAAIKARIAKMKEGSL